MKKKLLQPKDVQEIYGINHKTLANWRSQGRGPGYVKAGGKILYPVTEIEKWLIGRRVRTDDSPDWGF